MVAESDIEKGGSSSTPFPKSGRFLTAPIQRLGERLPFPSGGVSADVVAQQAILRQFKHRFGVAANILESDDTKEANSRIRRLAGSLVEGRLVDEKTVLETRMLLPESDLRDSSLVSKGLARMTRLRHVLADEHDITRVIPNSHPIMPTQASDSPVDPSVVWGAISYEFDGLGHQFNWRPTGPQKPNLAILALTKEPYARHIFGGQVAFQGDYLQDQIMLLHDVGDKPHENVLVPPHPAGTLAVAASGADSLAGLRVPGAGMQMPG
ncbi:MAG TPA: hypothetical protein VFX86_01620 [Candidatus Saccharimonadales bacterium]|nr:hypothetical protein [Candidatus Saccharimonadales bacterium]